MRAAQTSKHYHPPEHAKISTKLVEPLTRPTLLSLVVGGVALWWVGLKPTRDHKARLCLAHPKPDYKNQQQVTISGDPPLLLSQLAEDVEACRSIVNPTEPL